MTLLFVDNSKASKKILTSKVFDVLKHRINVVEDGTVNDSITPSAYNIMAFPTLVDDGIKYVGADNVFNHLKAMERKHHSKPLF